MQYIYIYISVSNRNKEKHFLFQVKETLKGKSRIIGACSMTIFTLFAFFGATAAWFAAKKKVDANGSGFTVVGYDGLVKSITLYKQDPDNNSDPYVFKEKVQEYQVLNGKTVDKTPSGNSPFSRDLYLGAFSQKSIAVLALFQIDPAIALNHKEGVTVQPYSSAKNPSTHLEQSGNSRSRIIQFSYTSITNSIRLNNTDNIQSGSPSPEYFYSDKGSGLALDATGVQGYTYSSISFNNRGSDAYFGVIIEYSSKNLDSLYSANIGNDVISESVTALTYDQDWGIRIS